MKKVKLDKETKQKEAKPPKKSSKDDANKTKGMVVVPYVEGVSGQERPPTIS